MSLFEGVVQRNDEIEDDGKRVENLIRGILAGNIFDLGSAQVCWVSFWASLVVEFPLLVFCYCCYVEAQATLCRISYVESTKQSWYFFFQVLLNSNIYTVKQMLFLLYSMKLLHAWTSNNSFFLVYWSLQKFLLKMACRSWQVAKILYLDLGLLMTLMHLRANGPRNHGKRYSFIAV